MAIRLFKKGLLLNRTGNSKKKSEMSGTNFQLHKFSRSRDKELKNFKCERKVVPVDFGVITQYQNLDPLVENLETQKLYYWVLCKI